MNKIKLFFSLILFKPTGTWSLRKSLWFNFRYLPFCQAIHLPVLLSRNVEVKYCRKNSIEFMGGVKFGILQIGYCDNDIYYSNKSAINIKGTIWIHGTGMHFFGAGLNLTIKEEGILEIGNNFAVSVDARINVAKRISIGNDNMWSYGNTIMDNDSHPIYDSSGNQINHHREVVFGNKVWMACYCIILKGADIPDGSIIAAGSIISKSPTQTKTIITTGGKVIRENITWER